jgi:hypothetical protein
MPNELQPQGTCELQGWWIEAPGLLALMLPVDAHRWVLADNGLQFFEGLLCLLSPLEHVLFLEELKKGSPLTPSRKMNLLKAAIHPVNFCTLWRLSGGFIFVIADTFSRFGSVSRWETIYLSNFSEGTPKVHFS